MKHLPDIINENNECWLADVRRCPSPNFDQRPDNCEIDLLVIHGISLPPSQYGGCYIDQLFTNCLDPDAHPYFADLHQLRVSTHLLINRRGVVTQYVPFNLRAWHAGESEFHGRNNCNDFSIGIELEGCDDEAYEAVQYDTLADISRLLMEYWPGITEQRIVGHQDIAPGRKTDPGSGFDWSYYFGKLTGRPGPQSA